MRLKFGHVIIIADLKTGVHNFCMSLSKTDAFVKLNNITVCCSELVI